MPARNHAPGRKAQGRILRRDGGWTWKKFFYGNDCKSGYGLGIGKSMSDVEKMPEKNVIPLESAEALWEWRISTDRLFLSKGACGKLGLAGKNIPNTMGAFLAQIPPACLPSLHELREGVLSGAAGSVLETAYPFNDIFIQEQMIVLDRDSMGRAIHVMGHYDVSSTQTPYYPPITTSRRMSPQSRAGYWRCSLQAGTIEIDAGCAALLGYPEPGPRVLGLHEWKERLHPEERTSPNCRYQLIIDHAQFGDCIEDLIRLRLENGQYLRVFLCGAVMERDKEGKAASLAGSLQNAEALKKNVEFEQGEDGCLLSAIKAAGDGLWDWDAQTNSVYFSPRYLSMLGYTAEEFPGCLDAWKEKIHPDDYDKIVPPQEKIVESPRYGDTFECTYRLKCADGTWAWILGRGYVTHRDDRGRATRIVGLHTNITTAQNDRDQLENLVKNDTLTGLRSRAFCDLELERMERNRVRPVSVISCDINGLKLINDYMGHAAGDKLLVQAAMLLRNQLRATDCVARMGGDEFVILLPGCPEAKAREILAHIEDDLAEHNRREHAIPVLISFGVAGVVSMNTPLSKLLVEADRRMIKKKAANRKESHRHIKNWIEKSTGQSVSLEDNRYES